MAIHGQSCNWVARGLRDLAEAAVEKPAARDSLRLVEDLADITPGRTGRNTTG